MERPTRPLVSNHHIAWNRAWYRTPLQRTFRQHEGLVIPMYDQVHRELHANLPPPPRPDTRLILGALGMLDELPCSTLSNPPETVLALSEHFLLQDNDLAKRLGHHLLKQAGYIKEGYCHS